MTVQQLKPNTTSTHLLYKRKRQVTSHLRLAASHLVQAHLIATESAEDAELASRVSQAIYDVLPNALTVREILELALDAEQRERERDPQLYRAGSLIASDGVPQ